MPSVLVLFLGFYAAIPPAMLFFALRRLSRYGQVRPLVSFLLNLVWGCLVGAGLVLLNAWLLGGSVAIVQAVRFCYFTVAAFCLLRMVDWFTSSLTVRVLKGRHPGRLRRLVAMGGLLTQRLGMVAFAIALAFALLLSYRPRVLDKRTPASVRLTYDAEQFRSDDGVRLHGWFCAAGQGADSATTVLLCHGVGSRSQMELGLAKFLVERGYNVMLFDFRAHGASGGTVFSYGDRERLDVLAAVRQLKQQHPRQARRIVALGTNTGAAAILGAAADPTGGSAIDALVLVEPFASFTRLADDCSRRLLPEGVKQIVDWVSVRLAGWQSGCGLGSWRPEALCDAVWPRPVLVIHGRGQTFVPMLEEMDVVRALPWPRAQYFPAANSLEVQRSLRKIPGQAELIRVMFRDWLGLHDPVTGDAGVRQRILEFLQDARRMPYI